MFKEIQYTVCSPTVWITELTFSCAWHWLHVLPRLALVASFPAHDTGCAFSRAWHQLYVFPRLTPVTFFPAVVTGYKFFHPFYQIQFFFSVFLIPSSAIYALDVTSSQMHFPWFYNSILSVVLQEFFLFTTLPGR